MDRSLYRILDANFNRAREAARVVEEFCRFVLDDPTLSARAKTLRHRLCALLGRIEPGRLIAARDTAGDVGRGLAIDAPMQRRTADDVFTAAVRRLGEALRALAEAAAVVAPDLPADLEALRFEAYDLEKHVTLAVEPARRFAAVRLYVILTVTPDQSNPWAADIVDQCCRGGADCIQLRPKGLTDARTLDLAHRLVDRCRPDNVVSIINDRVDIAIAAGADGVHLGQDDLPIDAARALLPRPMILGLSTHTADQLAAALDRRPTYVALGPAWPTDTKPHEPPAGLDYIAKAVPRADAAGIAHVAIGGITLDRLDTLLAAGARTVAVGSAILAANDPTAACQTFKHRLQPAPNHP